MNRYVLLKAGYSVLAIPTSTPAELGAVLAALSSARVVKSVGQGAEQRYVADDSEESPPLQVVEGSKVPIGDEIESLRARAAAAEKDLEQRTGWWSQEREKNAKLQKEVDAFKSGQPVAA